jgi:glycosidase
MNVYQENGYENRKEYLESLAEDFGVDISVVYTIASVYGPSEDFDGLVTALEDYSEDMY